jgi:hypothetical protein
MSHINFAEVLTSFEQPHASLPGRSAIGSHLAVCKKCFTTYQKIAEFFDHADRIRSQAVPQATTARLLNIFRPGSKHSPASMNNNFPRLVFDDWTSLVFERHAGIDARQLLYRSGVYEVDLRLEFVDDKCIVTGQLLPEVSNAHIEVSGQGGHRYSVNADSGEFEFEPLDQGTYDITISINGQDIALSDVPLHQ